MNYWHRLWRAELIGIASLLVIALIILLVVFVSGMLRTGGMPSDMMSALGLALAICFTGTLPTVIYGAPIFAHYLAGSSFGVWHLLLLAVAPGLAVMLSGSAFGIILALGGIFVALIMTGLAELWPMRGRGRKPFPRARPPTR